MCEECKAARIRALRDLAQAWSSSGNPGAAVIGRLVALGELDERSPADRQEGVNQLMLDSYESQRRDAISILSAALIAFTMIKNRMIEEASRAGDKRIANLQWDGEKGGYWLTGKDREGNPVNRFEPLAFGENMGQAAVRIMVGHLETIDEIHE